MLHSFPKPICNKYLQRKYFGLKSYQWSVVQGGGESYHGMWRADQPHGFGVFRWFDGDRYIGAWNSGFS